MNACSLGDLLLYLQTKKFSCKVDLKIIGGNYFGILKGQCVVLEKDIQTLIFDITISMR